MKEILPQIAPKDFSWGEGGSVHRKKGVIMAYRKNFFYNKFYRDTVY